MKKYIFVLLALLLQIIPLSIYADVRYVVSFELIKNQNRVEAGKFIVSKKQHTWSKGLQNSYLKLSCHEVKGGKIEKRYSIQDLFHGLIVVHKIVGDSIQLKIEYSTVKPRLQEIRALSKKDCVDMEPVLSTFSSNEQIPAKEGEKLQLKMGDKMVFRVTVEPAIFHTK